MGDKTEPTTPAPSPTEEGLADLAAAVGKAGAPGNNCSSSSNQSAVSTNAKILIIGAGMAGLSAANHLLQNGCDDFFIIEARSRVGGRIVSIPLSNNQKIELGANWIHGVLGNPIFEFAMQHGLVSVVNVPKPHKVVATTEDGHQVPFSILQEIYEAYVCFLRRCDEYFLCQYSPPPDIHSVGEHINYEIEIYLSSVQDPKEKRLKQSIFNCLLKRETCITGCNNMNEVDLLELGSYTELQGGNIVLPSGYSSILRPLSGQIPQKSILTKCPVKKIHWKRKKTFTGLETVDEHSENEDSDDSEKTVTEVPTAGGALRGASVESNSSSNCDYPSGNVRVDCEDGRVFHAAHVICTIPLGVLKHTHKTLFDPELPQFKQESIENLMFGTVDKIYLEYERPFLSADISEVMLLWNDDKRDMHTCTEEELASEAYLSKNWYKKIYSFAKVTDTLLLGWVSGREAEYMETLSHEAVAEKCTEILRSFLQDPYVPKPKRCVCTSWKSQEFTGGAYTSIPVGATQEDIENLAQPLYATPQAMKPAILFAGEHTHSSFYSTVHGAYLSGRTAAQYLLANDEPDEMIIMESDGSDLSAWIQGIALD
ncbi:peroxisomal N(1)-acetyl-spermine/spermidine oxidase isoform X1 [Drosophila pseudoobscura]|uniref:Peroxisomal N(1)-acetyl-spermine/spermidine oxidase isoform X1 n=2 Tax=Drosophila pseudoobscura pseudoobscura TaxID=46245 RepID=A0A6I8UPX9_DROPS|nr:peroxisomal N(1)-acetyl-spermine/spermidine oxidase isoform X1 [Drosophila pseudoobscura]XP_015037547.2 peroxisomal N(1)-acetyl-spermine/spermidine oxidase isoform X1 [Drosophila pseudoobscura]